MRRVAVALGLLALAALAALALWPRREASAPPPPELVLRADGGRAAVRGPGDRVRLTVTLRLHAPGQTLGSEDAPWPARLSLAGPGGEPLDPAWTWTLLAGPVALRVRPEAADGVAAVEAVRGPVARFEPGQGPWRVELAARPAKEAVPEAGPRAIVATLPWQGGRIVSEPVRIALRAPDEAGPPSLEEPIRQARLALRAGDARGALARAERLLARAPRLAAGHVLRADALDAQGRPEEALEAFRRALGGRRAAVGIEESPRYVLARMDALRAARGETQAEALPDDDALPPGGIPRIAGLRHVRSFETDASTELPGAETTVHVYRDDAGARVLRFLTAGVLWAQAWVPAQGGAAAGYALRDASCDGRYEERLPGDAVLTVPACVVAIAGGAAP